jgi:hypothetical protein
LTTATTATFDPTIDELVTDALIWLQVCNMEQDPEPAQLLKGRRFAGYVMKALMNEGVSLRVIERLTSTPAATITPASDTEDVMTAWWTDTQGLDHPIEKRARDEYDQLSQKATTAPPTQFFFDKSNGAPLITLWPIPDANVVTVSYSRRRRLRDTDPGSVTLDIPQAWHLAVLYKLCHTMAPHFGMPDKADAALADYEREKELANNADTETGPLRFVVAHCGPWDDQW